MSDHTISCICDGIVLYCPVHGSNLGYPVNSPEGVRRSREREVFAISPVVAFVPLQRELNTVVKHAPWPHDPRTAMREDIEAICSVVDAIPLQEVPITILIPPENVEAAKAMGMEVIEVPMPAGGVPKFRGLRERLDNPPEREEFSQWLERDGLREEK